MYAFKAHGADYEAHSADNEVCNADFEGRSSDNEACNADNEAQSADYEVRLPI
jgi:hypothetical protein